MMERPEENKRSTQFETSQDGLPEPEQTKVIHYAYDPETYEVLCRPGQRLTAKRAGRLQELKLYAHVVTSAK